MATIRDVMTANPVCADTNTPLAEVARKMRDADTGLIPIVGQNDQVVGVITDRDIVVRGIAQNCDPQSAKASDFMSREVDTITPDMAIGDAIRHMEGRQIRRLVVCENTRIVGVVSLGDLAETMPDQAEDVLVEVSKSEKTLSHKKR